MEVRVCAQPLPRLRSRKGLWLLALLTLRGGRDVERDWLCSLLWPDDQEADARRSLRQSLHDLRLALGPEAQRLTGESPRTLRLDLSSGAWADVLEFDSRTAARRSEQNPEELEAALHLYRGPLLEDCAEDWAIEERRQRERQYVTALETLGTTAAMYGGHTVAAGYLRRAMDIEPLREDLLRALMTSLAADGSVSAALLAFRQFRARLWQEMATEPDAETTALYQRLREEARKAARVNPVTPAVLEPPVNRAPDAFLPQPRTTLIGREEDSEAVIDGLMKSRLVTLTGTGGVGKTRLALQVAAVMADEFEGGARFVDLAALTNPADVPEAVRQAIGAPNPPEAARKPLVDVVCDYLRPHRLLLVLDNCEHLLNACASLADALLSAAPGLRILATSRQALGLRGESLYRVPSLALPPLSITEADYADYAAARLFVTRARDADSTFRVTPANASALARICQRLDGIPLALELAAARTRALTIEEIDARLDNQFRLLTGGDRAALPRQQTLRGALDWSWTLLTEPEQALLSRLSVFAGGSTLKAVEAVGGEGVGYWVLGVRTDTLSPPNTQYLTPNTSPDILDLLTALIDKSLVIADKREAEGTTRYRLLETVRQYAWERLVERGDAEINAVRARHQEYFAAWVVGLLPEGEVHDGETHHAIEVEQDNLRVALDWRGSSAADRPAAALRALDLAGNLGDFWRAVSRTRESAERLGVALAFAEAEWGSSDDEAYRTARAKGLRERAAAVRELGDYAEAQDLYEKTLTAYQALGDRKNIASAYREMGMLAWLQGDFPRAESYLEEGLSLFRVLEDRRNIALSFMAMGIIAGEQADLDRGADYFAQALPILRELGDRRAVATTLINFSRNAQERGDHAAAQEMIEESLAINREIGNQGSVAVILFNLGLRDGNRGDYVAARQKLEEALAIFRDADSKIGVANALRALAATYREQGDFARARALLCEALVLHRELGNPGNIASTLQAVAMVAVMQEQFAESLRLLGAADSLREAHGLPLLGTEEADRELVLTHARAGIGDSAADAAWNEGRAMDLETAYKRAAR
jgi:predicted ATPase/DNA-binding SARP family transcriptional activator